MTKSLNDAYAATKRIALTINGLNDPGATQPSDLQQSGTFPFVVVGPGTGNFGPSARDQQAQEHEITLEIHAPMRQFPKHFDELKAYGDTVASTFLSSTNVVLPDSDGDATVSQITNLSYNFGPLGYGTFETYGWSFTITVRLRIP